MLLSRRRSLQEAVVWGTLFSYQDHPEVGLLTKEKGNENEMQRTKRNERQVKTPTVGRFAPLSQVPPIVRFVSFISFHLLFEFSC